SHAAAMDPTSDASLALRAADASRVEQRALEVQIRVLGDVLDDVPGRAEEITRRRAVLEEAVEKRRADAIRGYAAFVDDAGEALAPEHARALAELASLLRDAGDAEGAILRYEALSREARSVAQEREAHLALAELHFALERLDAALVHAIDAADG